MDFVAKLFGISELNEGKALMELSIMRGRTSLDGGFSSKLIDSLGSDIAKIFNDYGLNACTIDNTTEHVKGAIDDGRGVMTTIPTKDGNHDIIIVGYNHNGYIVYDTDKTAGYYKNIPESDVNAIYMIGIKK